jgi:hypothetical protein
MVTFDPLMLQVIEIRLLNPVQFIVAASFGAPHSLGKTNVN